MCERGGEGPWFVSVGDLEDQTLVAAVVVVDLVPVVLCSCVVLVVPGHSTTDPDTAVGALAVTPDPGDRAGRANSAAAL